MSYNVRDADLRKTRALPASASATVDGAIIDLGQTTNGRLLADFDFLLTAPAVNATMAPDTRTFTYSILTSANSDLSSPTVVQPGVIVQTGAGGAGAASTTYRFRLPSSATARYVGVRVVSGASTADASTVSATLEALF